MYETIKKILLARKARDSKQRALSSLEVPMENSLNGGRIRFFNPVLPFQSRASLIVILCIALLIARFARPCPPCWSLVN